MFSTKQVCLYNYTGLPEGEFANSHTDALEFNYSRLLEVGVRSQG